MEEIAKAIPGECNHMYTFYFNQYFFTSSNDTELSGGLSCKEEAIMK